MNRRQPPLTELLVSVRNVSEAILVSKNPDVRIVDVKEPHRGSLGRADPETWATIADKLGEDTCLSLALGELEELSGTEQNLDMSSIRRFRFAKIGLSNMARVACWRSEWQLQLDRLPPGIGRVGVAYVDSETSRAPSIYDVIEASGNAECEFLLLDTFDKLGGHLLDFVTISELRRVLDSIQSQGMKSVVAGSVDLGNLEAIVDCRPNFVGVRGAVCIGNRQNRIDEYKLERFVHRLNELRCRFYTPSSPPR